MHKESVQIIKVYVYNNFQFNLFNVRLAYQDVAKIATDALFCVHVVIRKAMINKR